MAKLGDLIVKIGADTRDLNKSLGKVRREMRSMSSNFEAVGQSLTKSLTLPLAAVGTFALKSAADLEKLEVSFISLTGGAEQASIMMEQLNEFTAKTPFQIDAVAKSARQLIASGTEISEVNNQLQFLGDIAATSGASIDEIAAIFAKVNAKGKVELENLNQLAERGIPIFKTLSETTGLLPSELGGGAVSVEEFNDALRSFAEEGGIANGAMERLSETASGKFSTALDNLKQAGAAMMDDLLPAFKGSLDGVINLSKKIGDLDVGTKRIIVTTAAFVAAIGPLLIVLPKLIAGVTALRTGFIALNAAMLANPISAIAITAGVLTVALASLVDTTSQAQKKTDEFIESLEGLDKKQKEVGITTRIELLKTEKVQMEVAARAEEMSSAIGQVGNRLEKQVSSGSAQRYKEQVKNLGEEIALLETELQNLSLKKLDEDFEDSTSTTVKATEAVLRYSEALKTLQPQLIETDTGVKQLQQSNSTVADLINETVIPTFSAFETQLSQGFASAIVEGENFAENMKNLAKQLLQTLLSEAIANAITNASSAKNPANQISGGLSIPAFIAAAVGSVKAAFGSVPALAAGGLAFGETMSIVGDNRNAAIDPEVIAPLSKLRDYIGGGSTNVYGRISGDDILISNARASRDRNRFA